MKTRIQRWGNSLAVRIPKTYADEIGLTNDTQVEMKVQRGKLILAASGPAEPALGDLLRRIEPSNLHDETDTGPAVGREIW